MGVSSIAVRVFIRKVASLNLKTGKAATAMYRSQALLLIYVHQKLFYMIYVLFYILFYIFYFLNIFYFIFTF